MPSPVGHGLMGVAIYTATVARRRLFWSWGFLALCVGASLVQDLDFIIPAMFGRIDVTLWAHRSFTHTVFFALAAALVWWGIARLARPRSRGARLAAAVVLVCFLVHIALDVMNEDTRPPFGVAIFWPAWGRAFYLNIGLLPSVHKYTYADLVSWHNVTVALTELVVFGALVVVILAARFVPARLRPSRRRTGATSDLRPATRG